MGIADLFWLVLILGGACWLLYHFLWKKKGSCHDCSGCSCSAKK